MKNIKEYINESIEYQIDEGLKDWIKKAAVTAAVGAACLNLNAAPLEKVDSLNDYHQDKTEQVQKVQNETKSLTFKISKTEDGNFELMSKPSHNKNAAQKLATSLESAIKKEYSNMSIKQVKQVKSTSNGTYAYIFVLGN